MNREVCGACERRVVRHKTQEHKPRADERLGHEEGGARARAGADGVAARVLPERPHDEQDDCQPVQTARRAVRELDHRLGLAGLRERDRAVAQGPVRAAAVARTRRAHVSAPEDDRERERRHAEGVSGEVVRPVGLGLRADCDFHDRRMSAAGIIPPHRNGSKPRRAGRGATLPRP